MDVTQIAELLNQTLSHDGNVVRTSTEALDRFSSLPHFPFALLSIAAGGQNQGQRVAASTYLKNFARRKIDAHDGGSSSKVSNEFKAQLIRTLLQAEPSVLKVLVEAFRIIVVAEFVKQNSWPELVPELRSAIQSSNVISNCSNSEWSTINALTILHALVRPFQYFLNPKVAKEPVPPQLELIAKEILAPLLTVFHHLVEKALATFSTKEVETEKILLLTCKCLYFAVRSYMPSAVAPLLPSFCHGLIHLLGSLSFDHGDTSKDEHLLRLKTGKRALLIFCSLTTRHRKFCDKLMPDIVNCVLKIVKFSSNLSNLDFLSERVISLAFDVVAHVLETGPGWRLVSPHFSFLLESAILPALMLNEKDISEWEEDPEEYIRKNLPSELEEISGWREDLFTARKSAINLLGVISMSKGPPIGSSKNFSSGSSKRKKGEKPKRKNQHSVGEVLVLPFLSKFPIPSDATASDPKILKDYYGVLLAFGGLQDFLGEQKPACTTTLIQNRVLPLYSVSFCPPYLVAAASWVLGELASCLPEEMSTDIYSSLLKALTMPDQEDTSCYPVRVAAAGAIAGLLENEYLPPEWLPLLQVVISRIGNEDEENIILFQLLNSVVEAGNENVVIHIPHIISSLVDAISKSIHPNLEPWPHVVVRGFEALAVMTQSWESFMLKEDEQNVTSEKQASGQAAIARALSALLQQAWLTVPLEAEVSSPPPSCIDHSSTLLRSIMLSVTGSNVIAELRLPELLLVWADLISDWHAWEESEDMSVFDCIKEVVSLHSKYGLENFIVTQIPPTPAPPVPQRSIIEAISAFVSEAILQYPSATWRACSCVHMLLHVPNYSCETQDVKLSLTVVLSRVAFSRFRGIRSKPCSLWKPLLVAMASCYLCYPDNVEAILEKEEAGGFATWASALAFACTHSSEICLSAKSEIKLMVMTLVKMIERLLGAGNPSGNLLRDCLTSLIEISIQLKELDEEMEDEQNDEESEDDDNNDDEDEEEMQDDDEESESEQEETEEEFLERYAQAASALENGIVEEGDAEDQDLEIELGTLEEVDQQRIVVSLMGRYHHAFIQGQGLSSELVSRFINAFPECSSFFQQSI